MRRAAADTAPAADAARRLESRTQTAQRRVIFNLVLFGVAFGYLEAAVVVYLRTIGTPIRAAAGLPSEALFPLLRLDQLAPSTLSLVKIELAREAATLLMLWTVSRGTSNRLGAFLLAFGVWDLAFYLWLRVLIGWPLSLLTWDILFLLPVPWAAPVLAPSIVAATMTVFGAYMLAREPDRRQRQPGFLPALLLAAGAGIILISFLWDWKRWLAGGVPRDFPWTIFALGEAFVMAGFRAFSRDGIL